MIGAVIHHTIGEAENAIHNGLLPHGMLMIPCDSSPQPTDRNPIYPHPVMTRYYADDGQRQRYVVRLFDASARHYDAINQLMSLGTGHRYRREALLRAGLTHGMHVLDVGAGTGALALSATQVVGACGSVTALEPSRGMLQETVRKCVRPAVQGTAEHLPFADNSFDMVTMGYALRHIAELHVAFHEYQRVLKPGGSVLMLEITTPASWPMYYPVKCYFQFIIPTLALFVRRSQTARIMMSYFWDTIAACVPPHAIMEALQRVGFAQIKRHVVLGIFSEYMAQKPLSGG
jgi:demethylmenaquinone methyltransferase / 2-methoxy-6-polyprenyl-1,4-benzoquinol methylase